MFARIINAETSEPAETGVVAEVITWSPDGRYPADWVWVECPDDTRQFAFFDGETFDNPPIPDPPPYEPPPPILPPLTRKKLRKALLEIKVTAADVEAYIAAIPDEFEREDAMIDWQDSDEYHRDHPLIELVASALQLPAEQVDTLWAWAAAI